VERDGISIMLSRLLSRARASFVMCLCLVSRTKCGWLEWERIEWKMIERRKIKFVGEIIVKIMLISFGVTPSLRYINKKWRIDRNSIPSDCYLADLRELESLNCISSFIRLSSFLSFFPIVRSRKSKKDSIEIRKSLRAQHPANIVDEKNVVISYMFPDVIRDVTQ